MHNGLYVIWILRRLCFGLLYRESLGVSVYSFHSISYVLAIRHVLDDIKSGIQLDIKSGDSVDGHVTNITLLHSLCSSTR